MLRRCLQVASSSARLNNHRCDRRPVASPAGFIGGRVETLRSYWGFSKPDNDDNDDEKGQSGSKNDSVESKQQVGKGGLVSPFGDNSPTLSPIIILPTAKRPVFPGYLSALTLKDPATINAISNNTSSTAGYVGLFLRKPHAHIPTAQDTGTGLPGDSSNSSDQHAGNDASIGFRNAADVTRSDGTDLILNASDIYNVGTFSQIQSIVPTEFGTQVLLMGHRRISLGEIRSFGPPTIADVDHWMRPAQSPQQQSQHMKAFLNEVIAAARELIKHNPLLQEQLQQWVSRVDFNDPYKLADFATALTTAEGPELQKVLEASDPQERLSLTLELLAKEREIMKLQREISKQVEDKVSKQQREYFLREQLKNIKQELGMERDEKDDMLLKYRDKLAALDTPEKAPYVSDETRQLIKSELEKLQSLDKNAPEFNVTRSYLDWLLAIPWGEFGQDLLDIHNAREILDDDHYGLEEIKDRILEFIAVGKLKGTVAGKIICFIGPPGVGKTSIAKSISRALNKKFYRFSVGGLTDTAEIKGHRRTYIGAMPGKPVLCLKSTAVLNPLILIDEIDKLGRSHSGDPASALLELLDPNQNNSFVDHYLDHPVDFSNVLFVCTANDESTIPGPLRDRMEIIRLSGYDIPEKLAIAKKYLVPKALQEAGLVSDTQPSATKQHPNSSGQESDTTTTAADGTADGTAVGGGGAPVEESPSIAESRAQLKETKLTGHFEITDEALQLLVKNYCRESGVRSLEKMIEKVARKMAFKAVTVAEETQSTTTSTTTASATATATTQTDNTAPTATTDTAPAAAAPANLSIVISVDNLEEFAGKPVFTQDTIYDNSDGTLPPGVVMGLAWNPLGGSPIFIETAAIPVSYSDRDGGGVRVVTGQLGDVMKESVNIAYTYARQFVMSKDPDHRFFNSHQLHLHVPEGAVSKDGPSAGVAMTTSLISIATHRSLQPKVAMTGEISLTGKVLPVGGIKEKVLAARRAGADTVVLPLANKRDYDELPQYVKDNVNVHFAAEYEDVFDIVFAK